MQCIKLELTKKIKQGKMLKICCLKYDIQNLTIFYLKIQLRCFSGMGGYKSVSPYFPIDILFEKKNILKC